MAAFGQSPTKKQYIAKAEEQFADKNYYGALIYYNEALEFDENDTEIIFKSAESEDFLTPIPEQLKNISIWLIH